MQSIELACTENVSLSYSWVRKRPFVAAEFVFLGQSSVFEFRVVVDFPCKVTFMKDFEIPHRLHDGIFHCLVYKKKQISLRSSCRQGDYDHRLKWLSVQLFPHLFLPAE